MEKSEKVIFILQIILIFCWLSFLVDSDSYFMPYLSVGMLGSFGVYSNCKNKIKFRKNKENVIAVIFAALFSILVLLANYSMMEDTNFIGIQGNSIRLAYILVLFWGGYLSMYYILLYLGRIGHNFTWRLRKYELKPSVVFGGSAAVISGINLVFLFLAKYPGNLSTDSINQISQILSENYSNHHPFYHTMLIKLFLSIGLLLFEDINAAVALYSVFQILFMAACFSYVVLTLFQRGISFKLVMLVLLWYAAMPFHIMYSFTMWKDVIFGGMSALFLVSLFRIQKKIGKFIHINYLVMIVGGMGICLFRSNGWFAFALSAICFFVLFRKEQMKLFFIFIGILAGTFVLKHTVLGIIGVSQPDTVEALSIPVQQISRVIVDGGKLTDNQLDMLEQVVDVEQIRERYTKSISDPIKNLVREKGNQKYLVENMAEYFKLYIDIGMKNPVEYIKAWIDETKGYWNGGYSYWRWTDGIEENQIGINRISKSASVNEILNNYLWLYSNTAPLQIFLCIGLYVWGIILLGYICIVRKSKESLFMCIPNLAVIFSLMITAPVYSEFRYVYSIFCTMPFLIFTAFCE